MSVKEFGLPRSWPSHGPAFHLGSSCGKRVSVAVLLDTLLRTAASECSLLYNPSLLMVSGACIQRGISSGWLFNIMTLAGLVGYDCCVFIRNNPSLFMVSGACHSYSMRGEQRLALQQYSGKTFQRRPKSVCT
ncbi:hypothetical protein J6590_072594 [Homalodisca vitripennis]|nr:hypothetical protein J6590_072594 [Homalodisca vitripennis]